MIFKDKDGFYGNGTFYKGNLHSHTVNSDGHLSPEESAALFKAHGYSFLCFSEHERYTDLRAGLDSEDFIILPGLEASSNLLNNETERIPIKVHHMHGILGNEEMARNATESFEPGAYIKPEVYYGEWDGLKAAKELNERLKAHGCLTTYNHPVWSRVEPDEFLGLDGVWGLEIYNYNTVNESNTGADTTYWDLMLRKGRRIYGFASDDNHNGGIFDDACGGWICVKAERLTHEDIINGMLGGNFYSSSGPEIYGWGINGDKAYVDCSAAERVNFICGGAVCDGATVIAPTRDGLKHAEYRLKGTETYVRVECMDYSGKCAWTNAIFTERA